MTMRKIAFFDFDDTLVPKDSMKRLIFFCIKKHPLSGIHLFKIMGLGILYYLKRISFLPLKEAIIFPLNILSSKELKLFYQQCLIPNYYKNVLEELYQKKSEGYLIYLVTASPEAYMQYTDLPIDKLIGTNTKKIDGKHRIIGQNCKDKEKVFRIQCVLKEEKMTIDYDNSYGYSDSVTDLPMLRLVKHRIRINKKDGSMSQFE